MQFRFAITSITMAALSLMSLVCVAGENSSLTLEEFMGITNVVESQISPRGDRVVSVLAQADMRSNQFRFELHLSAPDGFAQQLTEGPADFSPRWSPDGNEIAFLTGIGGNDGIAVLSVETGQQQILIQCSKQIENLNWSPDGKTIAVLAPSDSFKDPSPESPIIDSLNIEAGNQLFLVHVESGELSQLTHTKQHISGFCWSPDSKQIAFSEQATRSVNDGFEQDIFRVAIESNKIMPLVVRPGQDEMPEWSPDGELIAFQSTCGQGKFFGASHICIVDLDGKPKSFPTAADGVFKFDGVDAMDWDADSRGLFLSRVHGVTSCLERLDLKSGTIERITDSGVYSGFSFSKDRTHMAFHVNRPEMPPEPYTSSVSDFTPRRTLALNPTLGDTQLAKSKIVHWTSSMGVSLQGIVYMPADANESPSLPLITYLHGGPCDTFRNGFGPYCLSAVQMEFFPVHVLVARGYAVFCPNPRGSGGRGPKFRALAAKDWGPGPMQDVLSGIDALVSKGIADPNRLAIGGICYGGYLTAWTTAHSDRFSAAITGACIAEMSGQFGLTDVPKTISDYLGGAPWQIPEFYQANSPLFHAESIRTPTLLHHGDADKRVPVSQSRQMFRALSQLGVPSELHVYRDEGHIFGRPQNLLSFHTKNLEWLERWLKAGPETESEPVVLLQSTRGFEHEDHFEGFLFWQSNPSPLGFD